MKTLQDHRRDFEEWAKLQGSPFFEIRYSRTSRTTSRAYEWYCPQAWTVWQAATRYEEISKPAFIYLGGGEVIPV